MLGLACLPAGHVIGEGQFGKRLAEALGERSTRRIGIERYDVLRLHLGGRTPLHE
jgi:hypothetical protein